MDSRAIFRVEVGFYTGTTLWPLITSLITYDPYPVGWLEKLTVAEMINDQTNSRAAVQ